MGCLYWLRHAPMGQRPFGLPLPALLVVELYGSFPLDCLDVPSSLGSGFPGFLPLGSEPENFSALGGLGGPFLRRVAPHGKVLGLSRIFGHAGLDALDFLGGCQSSG